MPTEALIIHVLISKYCDFLPLYRQSQMLARQGLQSQDAHRTALTGRLRR